MLRSIDILTFTDDDLRLKKIDPAKVSNDKFEQLADYVSEEINDNNYWADSFDAAVKEVLGEDYLTEYALNEEPKQPFVRYLVTWQAASGNGDPVVIRKLKFDSVKEGIAYMDGAISCDRYGGEDFTFVDTPERAREEAQRWAKEYGAEDEPLDIMQDFGTE